MFFSKLGIKLHKMHLLYFLLDVYKNVGLKTWHGIEQSNWKKFHITFFRFIYVFWKDYNLQTKNLLEIYPYFSLSFVRLLIMFIQSLCVSFKFFYAKLTEERIF